MTALTDEEVVQIAREAVAKSDWLIADAGYDEETMAAICAGSYDELDAIQTAILGARAVAAKQSGGAGEPVAWLREDLILRGDRNVIFDREHAERSALRTDEWRVTPLYAHPPAEPAVVPARWKLVPIDPTEAMIDAALKVDWSNEDERAVAVNVFHAAIAATPPSSTGDMEREGEPTYTSTQATNCAVCGQHKHTPLRVDRMGGYVCLTCIDREICKEPPAPGDDLVERLRRYESNVSHGPEGWNLCTEAAARITADAAVIAAMKAGEDPTMWDFWNKKARELAEKNTALRAVIAGKDAEIERLTRSYDTCLKCYEGAIHRYEQAETAEARITDLQAALIIARDRFASYRDQHQAKGTDDGHAKALRNAEMVEMIDHALAGKATADAGERDAQG